MEEIIIRKLNGESRRAPYRKEILENYKHKPHLCKECNNGCPNRCKKVNDQRKRNISYYKFITQGYQIVRYGLNENGEKEFIVDEFIVEECDNYVREVKKEKDPKAMEKRANLMTFCYGTETVEEAQKIIDYDNRLREKYLGIMSSPNEELDIENKSQKGPKKR